MKEFLKSYGATTVVTENELRHALQEFGPVKLALNCVGGKMILQMVAGLAHQGVLVSYGAMSMAPMMVPTGPLIFKDVSLRGFWLTEWKRQNPKEQEEMYRTVAEYFISKKLVSTPRTVLPMTDFKKVFSKHLSNSSLPSNDLPVKVIFDVEN